MFNYSFNGVIQSVGVLHEVSKFYKNVHARAIEAVFCIYKYMLWLMTRLQCSLVSEGPRDDDHLNTEDFTYKYSRILETGIANDDLHVCTNCVK